MSTSPTSDSAHLLQPGAVFGRYTIVRQIGRGGMGAVFEATHTELGKRVALKTLHQTLADDPTMKARFVREGQAASKLRHPHAVDVTDVGVHEGVPFLVMEFLEGEDLGARLSREGALSPGALADVLLPVLAALSAAHAEGIVHRDLKPSNIFLAEDRDGTLQPKLLDFGISKVSTGEAQHQLTGSAALLGTPFYMSPEQARSGRNVDARSDQYALGVILYECSTGRKPFTGDTLYDLLHAIVVGSTLPPRQLRPSLPEGFEALILRAMRRRPEERFPSVADLALDLAPYASVAVRARWEPVFSRALSARAAASPGVTVLAPAPAPLRPETLAAASVRVAPGTSPGSRRATVLLAACAVLGVAAGSLAMLLLWPHVGAPPSPRGATTVTLTRPAPVPPRPAVGPSPVAPPAPVRAPAEAPSHPVVALPHDAGTTPGTAPAPATEPRPPTRARAVTDARRRHTPLPILVVVPPRPTPEEPSEPIRRLPNGAPSLQ